jgi:hypothetical protein
MLIDVVTGMVREEVLDKERRILAFHTLTLWNYGSLSEIEANSELYLTFWRSHVSIGVCSQPIPFYSVPHVTDH